VIGGYSELVLGQLGERDPARAAVEQIARASQRAGELTQQLLAFGRRQVLKPKTIDLDQLVRAMRDMLGRLLGEDVLLTVSGGESLGYVTADPNQMEQVIMNLVVNARDAMPQGGMLEIATFNVPSAESPVCGPDKQPCAAVCLRVSDTGTGMDEQTIEQIFEPFFTTKPVGQGSGLGLSTAFGITKQSGGTIKVRSELGHGTAFSIFLPATGAQAEHEDELGHAMLDIVGGDECILLVEDEAPVREYAAVCLRGLGYRVLEASGPREALACAHRHPVDLLLTDVVMPEGGGRALAEELTRREPGLPVLFMTGYADDLVTRGGLASGAALMQKPLTRQSLAFEVRRALDGRTSQLDDGRARGRRGSTLHLAPG
jgi:two-component system cell cycle sensor histidine kinase/response regulator CckA